jgi:proton glutamate symport protein
MFKFTNIVMLFAPIGVGAAIAYTVGHLGIGILVNLAKLLLTMYARGRGVRRWCAAAGGAHCTRPDSAVHRRRRGADVDRVCDRQLGSGAAARDGEHGGVRRAAARRGVRDPTGYSFNLDGSTFICRSPRSFVAQAAGIEMPHSDSNSSCC